MKKNLEIEKNINILKHDKHFIKICADFRKNPNFDANFKMFEAISRIDKSKYKIDQKLLQYSGFNEEDIKCNIIDFFTWIDVSAKEIYDILPIVKQNLNLTKIQKLTSGEYLRSYCKVDFNQNSQIKEIGIFLENRIGDTNVAIHEMVHSLSKSFTQNRPYKDKNMVEVCSVISDKLVSEYMQIKYPNLKQNIIENEKERAIINVKKARECLVDALVIKLVLGEISIKKLYKKYSKIFEQGDNIINNCIKKIKETRFHTEAMFEAKYLIPQAIANVFIDEYKLNKNSALFKFKYILANDIYLTVDEVFNIFDIKDVKSLIKNYIKNYHKRIK